MGLLTETFTRKTALPRGLVSKLTAKELEYFTGTKSGKSWVCERVELNALRPSQRLAYVEAKLEAYGGPQPRSSRPPRSWPAPPPRPWC